MTTKKQDSNKIQTKGSIRSEIIFQQKKAYYLCKFLRSKAPRKVSYIISTEIIYKNGFWIPVTKIRELPELRIHHGAMNSDEEFLEMIDIDNVEE